MSKKILFSPIGGTDPIKYHHDGSMLHICRHFQPDIVYLYLSHEMLIFHQKDNRYVDALTRLGKLLDHTFEIRIIERNNLINVQQYDEFYQDFRAEIQKIENEMSPDDKLLLNMASGTPAMKSALFVMATFAEYRFQPIRVSTPQKKMNDEHEDRENYNNETYWNTNEDNKKDAPNRCTTVHSLNLTKMLKIEAIKKHIMAYDYTAALSVAEEIRQDIPDDAYQMIKIADARSKLNLQTADELNRIKHYDIFPITQSDKKKIFEYALVLQLKIIKQEYSDYIRGITPLVVDLLEIILATKCGIILEDCCTKEDNVLKWDRAKLQQLGLLTMLNRKFNGSFKIGPVYSASIAKIIEEKSNDTILNQKIREIISIEQKVRNTAAHEIVSITDAGFRQKTGKSIKQSFELVKHLMVASGINKKEENWKSYDKMNAKIQHFLH